MNKKELINRYAYAEQIPDIQMTCPERCLWYTLRDVYRAYRAGDITKAAGEQKKRAAMKQYDIDCGVVDSALKIVLHDAKMWKAIEIAHIAYNADRTLENADRFIEAVYSTKMIEQKEDVNITEPTG